MDKRSHDSDLEELLNDVLKEFNGPAPTGPPPTTGSSSSSSRSSARAEPAGGKPGNSGSQQQTKPAFDLGDLGIDADDLDEEKLIEQLTKMEALFEGIQDDDHETQATVRELMKQFEALKADLDLDEDGTAKVSAREPAAPPSSAPQDSGKLNVSSSQDVGKSVDGSRASFQDTIQNTMAKLRDSSKRVEAETAKSETTEEEFMQKLLEQMEGFAEEGQVDNMFEEMLDMFMSKNMLYDPMKELNQEYPKYLAANKDKLSKDEYRRYENQYRCVQEILAHFDQTPSGSDEDSSKSDKQVKKLMEKMQSYGQPPEDLIKILAPDLELGPDGVPKFPDLDQCNQM